MTGSGRRLDAAVLPGLAVALLLAMAILMAVQAWQDSVTYDEFTYIRSGTCDLALGVSDLEPTNPPLNQLLSGAGVILGQTEVQNRCAHLDHFFQATPSELHRLVYSARAPIILLSLLVAGVVLLWGRALHGALGGLTSLALVAFEPSVLAHGHLGTADMSLTFGFVVCLAAAWAWVRGPKPWLLLSGVGFGWALASKLAALELLPLVFVTTILAVDGSWRHRLARATTALVVIAAVGWLALCALYLPFHEFYHHPTVLPDPFAWLAPRPWFDGANFQRQHVADALPGYPSYLNGELHPHGAWYYYLEALGLKASLGLLALAAAGMLLMFRRRDRIGLAYLVIPISVTLIGASLSGIDLGIRYILPAFPLLALAAGAAVAGVKDTSNWRGAVRARWPIVGAAGLLVLATMVSSLISMPDHIGYFNVLAGPHPERYLSDSNLDWGQDAWRLKSWWSANGSPHLAVHVFGSVPLNTYGIDAEDLPRDRPVAGRIVVSQTELTVYDNGREIYALRGKRVVARIGRTLLVYDR